MKTRVSKGFTLLEVNLAIFIMATGVLAMCVLYSLGFRENRQSVEDVAASAFADAYLAPLVQGLSATNMTWTSWMQIGDTPSDSTVKNRGYADGIWPRGGWKDYVQISTSTDKIKFHVKSGSRSTADGVYGQVNGKTPSQYRGSMPTIPSDYQYGLVVTRRGSVIQLSFKISRRKEALMSAASFVSEVRFQGDPEL